MNATKIFLFIIGLAFIHSSNAQQMSYDVMQENSKEDVKVVQEAIATLRGMVSDDNAEAMGFRSQAEVEQARAGFPLPIVLVQLDGLRAYQRGNNVHQLFKNYQQQLVPLSVDSEVRSSITLERRNQRLSAVSYGSPKLVRALTEVRAEAAAQKSIPLGKFYVVHVAALRQYFVAYDDVTGKPVFIPVTDDPELGLVTGRPLSAEDALVKLQTVAQRYNDLPI